MLTRQALDVSVVRAKPLDLFPEHGVFGQQVVAVPLQPRRLPDKGVGAEVLDSDGQQHPARQGSGAGGQQARPERHRRSPKVPRLPLWRRSLAFAANGWRLVVLNGLRSWSRDARLTTPVIGTIALLLVLCGTLSLVGANVLLVLPLGRGDFQKGERVDALVVAELHTEPASFVRN